MPKIDYSRDELLEICEAAFVPEEQWWDRDSADAQRQVGEAYALLRAGCAYTVLHGDTERHALNTDDHTIWVEITYRGFSDVEYGRDATTRDHFYLPTMKRIGERGEWGDWY